MRRNKPRLQLLVVSPGVPPPPGGSERLAVDLVASARATRTTRLVSVSRTPHAYPGELVVRLRRAGRIGRILTAIALSTRLLIAVARYRPRLVHAVTWRAAAPLMLLPARLRPPLIVHILGAELLRVNVLSRIVRNRVLCASDACIAISRHTATVAQAELPSLRTIHVIPPGIDRSRLVGTRPVRVSPSRDRPVQVLSVGRLHERKGHADAVDAVASARSQGLDVRLKIIGSGPFEKELRSHIARSKAQAFVELVTGASDSDILAAYVEADIFMLLTKSVPNAFEGFGIVFLEAAAFGLPIIAGPSEGAADAVAPNSNAVTVDDCASAVSALHSIGGAPEVYDNMSRASFSFAEGFEWSVLSARIGQIYDELVVQN